MLQGRIFFLSLPVSFLCGSTRKITAVLGFCVLLIVVMPRKLGGLGTRHQRGAVTVWTDQGEEGESRAGKTRSLRERKRIA